MNSVHFQLTSDNLFNMDQSIYEDGSGNLYNEQGSLIAVLEMKVDNEQYTKQYNKLCDNI